METPTFIFAEAIPRLNMHLQSIGWDNLVQINFDCRDAFHKEGYVPMSELLAFITDHRIGTEEGYPEQTPLTVSFSIVNQKISAMYSLEPNQLRKLADRLASARICGGAFPIKIYGVPGSRSMFQ